MLWSVEQMLESTAIYSSVIVQRNSVNKEQINPKKKNGRKNTHTDSRRIREK